jgi:hypothetical protein
MDGVLALLVRFLELLFGIGWIGALLVIVVSLFQTASAVLEPDPPARLAETTMPPSEQL